MLAGAAAVAAAASRRTDGHDTVFVELCLYQCRMRLLQYGNYKMPLRV